MATLTASFLADLDELPDKEIEECDGELSTLVNYDHGDDLDSISQLQKSHWYISIMQKVEDALSCDHKSKLSDPEYDALILDCNALSIDSAKKKVLDFVESRMGFMAPNLSAVVGSAVAAKLIASAGGLSSLAFIPSNKIQLLRAKRNTNNLAGFSRAKFHHVGGCYIEQTDIIQSTPPSLRNKACRLLADKIYISGPYGLCQSTSDRTIWKIS